jgi:hypothetical protein
MDTYRNIKQDAVDFILQCWRRSLARTAKTLSTSAEMYAKLLDFDPAHS